MCSVSDYKKIEKVQERAPYYVLSDFSMTHTVVCCRVHQQVNYTYHDQEF